MKKRFWPILSGIIECDKPKWTLYTGPQRVLTNANCCGRFRVISASPKRLLRTKISEKKGKLSSEKNFWPIFPNLSSVIDLSGQFMGVHKVFWQLLWKLKDHSCNTWEFVGNTNFWKERQTCQWRKDFGLLFTRHIECDKPQAYFISVHNVFLTITVEVKRSFPQQLGVCWKHDFLKRKANFPVKKRLWPFISRKIECEKPHGMIYKGPQGVFEITVEVTRSFL